jgi:hypothetical protein
VNGWSACNETFPAAVSLKKMHFPNVMKVNKIISMHIDASHVRNHFDNMIKVEKLRKILFHDMSWVMMEMC